MRLRFSSGICLFEILFQLPLFRTILLQQYCRGMIKYAPFFSTCLAQYITGIVQGKQHADTDQV